MLLNSLPGMVPLPRAMWQYPLYLAITVVISNTVPYGAMALALTLVAAIAASLLRASSPDAPPPAAPPEDTASLLNAAPEPAPSAPRAPRLHYLDNLKSVLTILVIIHHTLGAFGGIGSLGLSVGNFRNPFQVFTGTLQILDQGYFMSLFFFISAYLTPASLDKKGPRAFLADKLRRLGVPFLFFFFVVGPLQTAFLDGVVRGTPLRYEPNAGQCWFLAWLLIFNCAAVAVEGALSWEQPSLGAMCAWGAGLGLLQGVQMLFLPAYFFMPITFGSLPFDAMFFAAGIAAARGGWLAAPLPRPTVWWARAGTAAFALGLAGLLGALYAGGGGMALLNANGCGEAPDRVGRTPTGTLLGALLALSTLCGVYAVCVSLAALDCFRAHAGGASAAWRWLAGVSYAAYLCHSVVVIPLTHCFILALRAAGGGGLLRDWYTAAQPAEPLADSPGCLGQPPPSAAGGALILAGGWAAVTAASLALVYPLAAALKRAPGLSRIL